MKKQLFFVIIGFLVFANSGLYAQGSTPAKDTTTSGDASLSILNLRPVLLNKGQALVSLRAAFPNFYKSFNATAGKPVKLPSYLALSEAYFNTYLTYGLSGKWNVFMMVPVADIHHYSPGGEVSGVGFADVEAGVDYRLINGQKGGNNGLAARLTLGFPTGRYQNLSGTQYPLGLGSFRFRAALTGIHQYTKVQMIYSAYYEYRTNRLGISMGDETGAYLLFRKPIETAYGRFGLEGGAYTYWNFSDKNNGTVVPNSRDYSINLYVGAWFQYLKKFDIRLGVPYSIYQNKAWMTQYQAMLQLDYLFK